MHVLVAGGSGFVGTYLCKLLVDNGYTVTVLSHRKSYKNNLGLPTSVKIMGYEDIPVADAIVNLAGASIAAFPLIKSRINFITQSRLTVLDKLNEAFLDRPFPKLLLQASATGIYAENQQCDETGKLADTQYRAICESIESKAYSLAAEKGCKVVSLRIGVVIGKNGGLARICSRLPKFRLLQGTNNLPWISIEDCARSIQFLLKHATDNGPINIVNPKYLSANQVIDLCKGHTWYRPFPIPDNILRILDKRADLLLVNHKIVPEKLLKMGFEFE